MFTVEQRDALRERGLALARDDGRVAAAALVGSLAVDGGDRFSDLDLMFAVADDVGLVNVLEDWTTTLADELDAVRLADLERGPTTYRVFLLPDALQLDLSMTPAVRFRRPGRGTRCCSARPRRADPGTPSRRPEGGPSFPRRRSRGTSSGGA